MITLTLVLLAWDAAIDRRSVRQFVRLDRLEWELITLPGVLLPIRWLSASIVDLAASPTVPVLLRRKCRISVPDGLLVPIQFRSSVHAVDSCS